nr:hypothetical protein [uncultured organism]
MKHCSQIICTDPVQPPHEASFGLLGDGKPTMVQGDQTKTTSDASLSASEAVGQSENNAVKGPLSAELKNLEKTSPEEKWNQQQQTDQSSTRPSKDGSIESSGTRNPNISTTSGAIQPSPLMESMQAIEGSRNQQQANRSVFQSKQDNKTQIEETEPQDTGSDEPKDSTQSTQLSPVRRDVANADQTDVSQGSLREPTSSDATHPTGKIQEFRPDDYLTNSEKPSVKGKTSML